MRKRIILKVALTVLVFLSGFSISANAAFVTLSGTVFDGGSFLGGVLVTASPTISCGSWSGATALTNHSGHFSMSVPDNCNFYISPSRKNYTFDPAYYYVTPSTVNDEFIFAGTLN